ncbi:MAG: universal stress protein [Armatimonadota bacterium]
MSDELRGDQRDDEQMPALLVGIANPESTAGLIDLATCLASEEGFRVIAVHVVEVPPQAHLSSVRGSDEMVEAREKLLAAIRQAAEEEVPVRGVVEVAREVDEGLISAAETQGATLLLVGYSDPIDGEDAQDRDGERRFDRVMYTVARKTEADLVVAKLRRERIRSILLPINTGLNLAVSGMLARAISRGRSAPVTLVHLLRDDEDESEARERLEADLSDGGFDGLGELAIERPPEGVEPLEHMLELANAHDLAIVGAEPRPSIAESIFGSWAERIAREAECTVLVVRAKSVLDEA